MSAKPTTVLLLGATGNVGRSVATQLLRRGVAVRALVRTTDPLSALAANPLLTLVQASVLQLSREEMAAHMRGCAAVVCCLGHTPTFAGAFGAPHFLVRDATAVVCAAADDAAPPARPVRFVQLSTAGASNPDGSDRASRGLLERLFIAVLSRLLPPWRDSVLAVTYLSRTIGTRNPAVEWCAVRPEWFKEGPVCDYTCRPNVGSLFKPGSTRIANVAHFICELVSEDEVWAEWKFKLPAISDNVAPDAGKKAE